MALLQLAAGLVLLFAGGEAFVTGASRLARRLGIPQIVIGLTVVSLGTSAPELATALVGLQKQGTPLVLGNLLGSNLFNLLVVLGACALVVPLRVSRRLVRRDLPVLLIATLAVWGMAAGGRLLWPAGLALLVSLAINVVWELVSALEQKPSQAAGLPASPAAPLPRLAPALGLQILGLAMLVAGSELLISGALTTARQLQVDETLIGLTLVAAGTSLPELVTSLVAAYRGQPDLAIGNVVGSSLLNLLLILGVVGLFSGSAGVAVPALLLQRDLPLLVAITLICLPAEQVVLAKLPTALGVFRLAVLAGVVPLLLAFLTWSVVGWWRVRHR